MNLQTLNDVMKSIRELQEQENEQKREFIKILCPEFPEEKLKLVNKDTGVFMTVNKVMEYGLKSVPWVRCANYMPEDHFVVTNLKGTSPGFYNHGAQFQPRTDIPVTDKDYLPLPEEKSPENLST